MSARDHLSIEEFGELSSQDYGVKMKNVERRLLQGKTVSPELQHSYEDREGSPEAYVNRLTDEVREQGIREPLTIQKYPHGDRWGVADGHHRYLAAKRAGLSQVPVRRWDEWGDDV